MGDSKNDGLQAARAIAALSVAYFHSYVAVRGVFPESAWAPIPWLKEWGFLGVNFFFAISGYVICMVASRSSFTVRSFVIKRVFRLYPMYWITMLVVAGLIAWGKFRVESVGHFLYSMTLLPQPHAPAYDFSWTLEREMVFYALAAITIPFVGIPGFAATLAGLTFAAWLLGNPWSFHLVSTTQADFLAGVLAFLSYPLWRRVPAAVPIVAGGILLWFTRTHPFLFSEPISMGLILTGFVNLRLPARGPLRWLVEAGDASYSIYLLHYLVFLAASVLAAQWFYLKLPDWACEPWRLAIILLCCVLSFATWRIIERPMIALGNRLSRQRSGIEDPLGHDVPGHA